jgi:hypothetical protein
MKNRLIFRVLLVLLPVVVFAFAINRLFELRFSKGNIYPPGSSLRSDPLGTRLLHDSLQEIDGLNVGRNLTPFSRQKPEGRRTLFYLNMKPDEFFATDDPDFLEDFVQQGGRLVLTFHPAQNLFEPVQPGSHFQLDELPYELWGARYGFAHLPKNKEDKEPTAPETSEGVSWHSTRYFDNPSGPWKVVMRLEDQRAVLIERSWGKGSVVLATDNYFLSNEALVSERQSALINYLMGENPDLIFDETHLGINRKTGVVALARGNRLYGGMLALALVAFLFVWRNANGLVPAHGAAGTQANVIESTRDSAAGLHHLLRRFIRPRDLIKHCFTEWRNTAGRMPYAKERREKMERLLESPAAQNNPVTLYQTLQKIWNRKD